MTDRNLEIRLRRKGSQRCLTIKGGAGRSRQEEEIELSARQFAALWPLTRTARLSKTRYEIPWGKKTIDLDVYDGRHRGLRVAEAEFESQRESDRFQPPEWFGAEITDDARYSNHVLARQEPRS